jgi:hypothetical protein
MFHLISVWLTRFVVAAVLIALAVMYGPKWIGEQANVAVAPTEKAAPAAPAAPAAAAPERAEPAAAAPAEQAAPAAPASFARCQPIGRTARGELVYSMDCRRQPGE